MNVVSSTMLLVVVVWTTTAATIWDHSWAVVDHFSNIPRRHKTLFSKNRWVVDDDVVSEKKIQHGFASKETNPNGHLLLPPPHQRAFPLKPQHMKRVQPAPLGVQDIPGSRFLQQGTNDDNDECENAILVQPPGPGEEIILTDQSTLNWPIKDRPLLCSVNSVTARWTILYYRFVGTGNPFYATTCAYPHSDVADQTIQEATLEIVRGGKFSIELLLLPPFEPLLYCRYKVALAAPAVADDAIV